MRYRLKAAGTLDLDELYPAAMQLSPALAAKAAKHIDRLSGNATVRVTASGSFDTEAPAPPTKYLAKIDPSGVTLSAKDLPQPIALVGGTVTLTPGNIELGRLMAAVAKPKVPGAVTVNGNLALDAGRLSLRQIAVEMHQIEIQQWLPLLVDPQDIAARGPLGGKLTIVREPSRSQGIRANGLLTMGAGEVQLGFLRAPIVAQSATLSLDGRGLLLAIIGAKLQGAPFDFSLGVADLDKPVLRIVANAGRLDLEVMKFIRLPWAPSPPAHFFPVPVVGHIEAAHAMLERLTMSRARCDFHREINGDWNVRNFVATMFEGRAEMEFSGRGRDDWINVKGRVNDVQVGPLFSLANPAGQPPLSGRLRARGDLWANSNTDFFNTMAGTMSIEVSDGVLHKFALLSRILGFVDLKTWLSAKVPDPRLNGVPFQTLTADFKGRDGDFYSDDLLLRGPGDEHFGARAHAPGRQQRRHAGRHGAVQNGQLAGRQSAADRRRTLLGSFCRSLLPRYRPAQQSSCRAPANNLGGLFPDQRAQAPAQYHQRDRPQRRQWKLSSAMRSRDTSRDVTLHDVTLIVFCREPLAGHTKTRLIPRLGAANAAELASAFIADALAKCRALAPRRYRDRRQRSAGRRKQ